MTENNSFYIVYPPVLYLCSRVHHQATMARGAMHFSRKGTCTVCFRQGVVVWSMLAEKKCAGSHSLPQSGSVVAFSRKRYRRQEVLVC